VAVDRVTRHYMDGRRFCGVYVDPPPSFLWSYISMALIAHGEGSRIWKVVYLCRQHVSPTSNILKWAGEFRERTASILKSVMHVSCFFWTRI